MEGEDGGLVEVRKGGRGKCGMQAGVEDGNGGGACGKKEARSERMAHRRNFVKGTLGGRKEASVAHHTAATEWHEEWVARGFGWREGVGGGRKWEAGGLGGGWSGR